VSVLPPLALVLLTVQSPPTATAGAVDSCSAAAQALIEQASTRAEEFDLPGALTLLKEAASDAGCDEAGARFEYVEGLLGAKEAARHGGTVDSLRDVRSAVHALLWRAERKGGAWEVASVALQATIAASQYEREEMGVYLQHATHMELLQLAAGQRGVPLISALELAGDLWLQVHRFEDARQAYQRAMMHLGRTGRIALGLARAAARLQDERAACADYRRLLDWWGTRTTTPPEIEEARVYLASARCAEARQ
jgi:hypothetical protein